MDKNRKVGMVAGAIGLIGTVSLFAIGAYAQADTNELTDQLSSMQVPAPVVNSAEKDIIVSEEEMNNWQAKVDNMAQRYLNGELLADGFEENQNQLTFFDKVFAQTGADVTTARMTPEYLKKIRSAFQYDIDDVQVKNNVDGTVNLLVDINVKIEQASEFDDDGNIAKMEWQTAPLSPQTLILHLESNGDWIGGMML